MRSGKSSWITGAQFPDKSTPGEAENAPAVCASTPTLDSAAATSTTKPLPTEPPECARRAASAHGALEPLQATHDYSAAHLESLRGMGSAPDRTSCHGNTARRVVQTWRGGK